MGTDNVNYLIGKSGDVDIRDCITAIEETLKKYPWIDRDRILVWGGSHGGFIGAHLSGQYPVSCNQEQIIKYKMIFHG